MRENVEGVSFPVVFYDGEHETNIGNITIHRSMDFKIFQSVLSQKIGISPHQFTVYRVNQKDARLLPEIRRRSPITANGNFAAIRRERDCFFLVVLKRSRKERRRRNSINLFQEDCQDFYDLPAFYPRSQPARFEHVPENVVLLRRTPELTDQQFNGFESSPYCEPVIATSEYLAEYKRRFRENYWMMTAANENWTNNGFSNNEIVCVECRSAMMKGTPAEFHCCFYDPAIELFKTSAGAIERPVKDSGEEAVYEISYWIRIGTRFLDSGFCFVLMV